MVRDSNWKLHRILRLLTAVRTRPIAQMYSHTHSQRSLMAGGDDKTLDKTSINVPHTSTLDKFLNICACAKIKPKMEVFCLLLLSVQICFCQSSYPLQASPSSVVVNKDNGEIFIAAGSQLLRLNNSLHLLENVTVSGGGELLVIALSPDGNRLVGCLGGDSRTCLVYDSQNLTSGESATVSNAHYNPENGLAIITTD